MLEERSAPPPPGSPVGGRRARAGSDLELDQGRTIYKFVMTGGPCAGKTTGLERLAVFLRERGFRVFLVPEAATMLFLNGAFPDDLAKVECQEAFQQFVIATQMSLEDSIRNYARSLKQKAVILCDRGIMDGSAYVDTDTWEKVLRSNGMDSVAAREGRYDAVFHLVTAADGAESFYSLSNNNARHESVEEARSMDQKTQRAWMGHPHHIIVDNRSVRPGIASRSSPAPPLPCRWLTSPPHLPTSPPPHLFRNGRSFERKMEQLVSMVAERVGLPSLTRRRHKFVLNAPPDLSSVPGIQVFDVEKIMLAEGVGALPEGGDKVLYSFIRKRSQGGFSAHGLTTVKQLPSGEQVELKQVISKRMYGILANSADKSRTVVRQRRFCFLWEQQSFHIYQFLAPHEGIWLAYCQSEGEPVLPGFLSAEPAESAAYGASLSTREISRIDRPLTPGLPGRTAGAGAGAESGSPR